MKLGKQMHQFVTAAVLAGTVGLSGAGGAFAGQTGTTDGGGGSTDPEPGATADTSWNPTNVCNVDEGEPLKALLACLASWIDGYFFCVPASEGGGGGTTPPRGTNGDAWIPPVCPPEEDSRGDYIVTYLPDATNPTGLDIRLRHPDPPVPVNPGDPPANFEPYRLRIRETSHNIQRTFVHVDRANLLAKIQLLEGTPSGGSITVTLNGVTIPPITTTPNTNIATLNQTLLSRISAAGFTAKILNGDIAVYRQGIGVAPFNLHDVSLTSTDNGIYKSQIALTPDVVEQGPENPN